MGHCKTILPDRQISMFGVESEPQIAKRKLDEMAVARKAELEILRRQARHIAHDPGFGWKYYGVRHAYSAAIHREQHEIVKRSRFDRRNNIMGCIPRCDGWVKLGYVASTTKGRHGVPICIWTLKDHEAIARTDWAIRESLAPTK